MMKIHVEGQLYYEKEDILGFFFMPSYNTVNGNCYSKSAGQATGQGLLNTKYGTTCFGINYKRSYNARENDFNNNFCNGESRNYLNIENFLNTD